MLTGDQVGILLGWWVIERARLTGQQLTSTLARSIVSSMILEKIATENGLTYENTLTGFKWVSRVPNLIFGYEEALGYCVDPHNVGDKDGISAAAMFVELASTLKNQGKTIWQQLDELSNRYGLFVSDQVSTRVTDLTVVPEVMNKLRNTPPKTFGGLKVSKTIDLAKSESGLPPTDGIIFYLSQEEQISGGRVIIRPSGTEPKIKCYLEVATNLKDLEVGRDLAEKTLAAIAKDAEPLLTGGR
jgi:phosphomannomutase